MTAERQVGERLSERKNAAAFHDLLARGYWPQAWALYDEAITRGDSLARQLAEAERAVTALKPFYCETRREVEMLTRHMKLDVQAEYLARFKEADEALAALNPPDPPASPAEGSEAATEVEA